MKNKKSPEELQNELKAYTVKFLDGEEITGTGFVISKNGLIATCSHVIQDETSQKEKKLPPKRVKLIFTAAEEQGSAKGACWAEVVDDWWRPINKGDVAILKLAKPDRLPDNVKVAPLSLISGSVGHAFQTFGYPRGKPRIGKGEIETEIYDSEFKKVRIHLLTIEKNSIGRGHSGSPILDLETECVVGMVAALDPFDDEGRLGENAFAIEVDELVKICPELKKTLHPNIFSLTEEQDFARSTLRFTLYTPKYFEKNETTSEDLEAWRNGFPFGIESIKANKEFRRIELIKQITDQLNKNRNLIIVGESGSSKSTILMEIICNYVDRGHIVLYNEGTELVNYEMLIELIESLLTSGAKVLVSMDNVHSVGTAPIFRVMDQLSHFELRENVRFLLTARHPDYDKLIDQQMHEVHPIFRPSIEKFNDPNYTRNFRLDLPPFSIGEIKEFIIKYGNSEQLRRTNLQDDEKDKDQLELSDIERDKISRKIYKDTKGTAIMVKFSVLGEGLHEDVKERWRNYLEGYPERITTYLACWLLEIAEITVTNKLLEKLQLSDSANAINNAILRQRSGIWSTIHYRYNQELLSYMYKGDDNGNALFPQNKEYFRNAVKSVVKSKDKKIVVIVFTALCNLSFFTNMGVENIIDELTENAPNYLSDAARFEIYMLSAEYYRWHGYGSSKTTIKKRNKKAINNVEKALVIKPCSDVALEKKARILWQLDRSEEAINCFNKALENNPNNYEAAEGETQLLCELERYNDAIKCYDKQLSIACSKGATHECWDTFENTIICLQQLQNYREIVNYSSRATQFFPDEAKFWIVKGRALINLKKYDEAIASFSRVTENQCPNVTPDEFYDACGGKGDTLCILKRFSEASECFSKGWAALSSKYIQKGFDYQKNERSGGSNPAHENFKSGLVCAEKAIRNVQNNVDAWYNKGRALYGLKKHEEAIECYNKAIELNVNHLIFWFFKGLALIEIKKYDDAIGCFEKTAKLEYYTSSSWNNKGVCFFRKKNYDEANMCYDKAIELEPVEKLFWYNRACAKAKQGNTEGALADLTKAYLIDKSWLTIDKAKKDKDLASIRNDDRFKNFIRRVEIGRSR